MYFRWPLCLLFLSFLCCDNALGQLSSQQLIGTIVKDVKDYPNVDAATKQFRSGNFDGARQLLHAAKRKHANLPPAEVMQAKLYLSVGRLPEAEEALERAVAQDRDDPESYLVLADLAFRKRQFTFAELTFNFAKKLLDAFSDDDPRSKELQIRFHAGQASIAELRGLSDMAIEHLVNWTKLDPKNSVPYARLAKIYFAQKNYDEAKSAIVQVGKLDKNAQRTEVMLGQLYDEAGLRNKAREYMESAARLGSKDLKTRLAVAQWAMTAGLTDTARQNAEAALKIDPKSAGAHVLAGSVARMKMDHKSAESLLRKAIALSPGNFAANNQLALTLAANDDDSKLQQVREYALLNVRTNQDLRSRSGREAAITLAWLIFKQGHEAEAEQAVQTAIRGGSISAESAFYVATIFAKRGQPQLAIKILKPVLGLNRAFPRRSDAQKLLKSLTEKK